VQMSYYHRSRVSYVPILCMFAVLFGFWNKMMPIPSNDFGILKDACKLDQIKS
jgi:hypothetical protein